MMERLCGKEIKADREQTWGEQQSAVSGGQPTPGVTRGFQSNQEAWPPGCASCVHV